MHRKPPRDDEPASGGGRPAVGPLLEAMGLRERKKARTRLQISDIATKLFLDRGFDDVTVAEVAKAANVSVKTVFNYFGAKEDLLFDREPEWLASIDALLAARGPGAGLLVVLRADLEVRWPALDFGRWDLLTEEAAAGRRRFYQLIADHAGLRARQLQMSERLRERFVEAAGADLGAGEPDAVVAGTLMHAAYTTTGIELVSRLLAGGPAKDAVRHARGIGLKSLDVLIRAYAGTPLVDGPPAR